VLIDLFNNVPVARKAIGERHEIASLHENRLSRILWDDFHFARNDVAAGLVMHNRSDA
jgi:hypothetical protein